MLSYARGFLTAALAGALGGALVGVAESVLVSWSAATADEYWLFLFAVVAYGLLGTGVGLGWAIVWQLVRRWRAREQELAQWAGAVAVAVPVLAVGRYHVAQRIFQEELVFASASGIITHLLLLLGAVTSALLVVAILRGCYRLAGSAGTVMLLVLLVGVAFVIGFFAGPAAAPETARRPAPAGAAGRPNIVLIVADALRADAVDWAGDRPGSLGGFAELARDGVVFERAYSQSSWTRPSFASILTAQYPSAHGTMHKMDFLPDRAFTVAEALQEQGYWTAAFTTNINVAPIFNFSQGFDEFSYLEPSFYFGATDSATNLAIYKGLRMARERFLAGRMYFKHYYQDAAVLDGHLSGWLAQKPPEPFFLFVHYMDPHDPYFEIPYDGRGVARVMTPSPPAEDAEKLHDLYMQGVRYLDGYLKSLVGQLKSLGLYDRTVLGFTADHGEEFQEHGGWWHGTALYEEQVRVPLVVKRAREKLAGQRRADQVRTIDVLPSMMAAAGLPLPPQFQGIDVFNAEVTDPLFAEEEFEGNRLASIQIGPWKLITANPGNPRGLAPTELYHIDNDPEEKHNLAAMETTRVADMLLQLKQLRSRIAEHGQGRLLGGERDDDTDPRT